MKLTDTQQVRASTLAKSSPRAFIPLISNLVNGVDSDNVRDRSACRAKSRHCPRDFGKGSFRITVFRQYGQTSLTIKEILYK